MGVKSAAVVGAGLAGLSAALELARSGMGVDLYESAAIPGGRAQQLVSPDGRFRFDTGPTLIVMTDVLRRALGEDAFAALHLQRLEPGYSVRWPDGESFDMHSDVALWLQNVERFEGRYSAARALDYIARVHAQYLESRGAILDVDFTPGSLLQRLFGARKLQPWSLGNLRAFTSRFFSHPRTIEALTFQSLYLGLSPARSPAIYALLPVVEIVGGVWYARGGTAAIVDALAAACERAGVRIRYGARVERVVVERGRARGVVVGGELRNADAVVVASDREPALTSLLCEPPKRSRLRYGHTAAVVYLGVDGPVNLPHHSVLLPRDPWSAYAQLDGGDVPGDPPMYVCNPAVTDDSVAVGSGSPLLLLIPVPNRAANPNVDEQSVFARALELLEAHAGPLRDRIVFRQMRGPLAFERDFGLAHGAAFGPDHALSQMGPFRPSIAYRGAANVAFAGSGTRPGSGVPLVLISGRLAAQRIVASLQ